MCWNFAESRRKSQASKLLSLSAVFSVNSSLQITHWSSNTISMSCIVRLDFRSRPRRRCSRGTNCGRGKAGASCEDRFVSYWKIFGRRTQAITFYCMRRGKPRFTPPHHHSYLVFGSGSTTFSSVLMLTCGHWMRPGQQPGGRLSTRGKKSSMTSCVYCRRSLGFPYLSFSFNS